MFYPIRCFSCGKPFSLNFWKEFESIKEESKKVEILKKYNIIKYCCRMNVISHKNINISI